ncbi:lipo-like protein [Glaciecola sp. MH2013]|uniref:YiiX/YebB-like N1pC/P60 family cysteine hydrolase n=1 Tax=Glaciecola sp. MH2013 TaxID=2785524 RepID=UPI00189D82E7|nr:YiiX/YebB-like N1pC/P60 family cysteine hydrolase [Glaciecola sp. MH2013]MBF7074405.1 lipo-like protein [Glaciecola sp. MH2013]
MSKNKPSQSVASVDNSDAKEGLFSSLGAKLAEFLSKPRPHYQTFSTLSKKQLSDNLQAGDLVLVEGNSRISTAIKYLTQSTWSHVAIFIGEGRLDADGTPIDPLIEADLVEGVIAAPIDKYDGYNLRICRPVALTEEDSESLVQFVLARLGSQYDTKNIFDLVRYLLPAPPVPERYRRRLLTLGSGDPTKAICSTLVSQAFQSIAYPILPLQAADIDANADDLQGSIREKNTYFHARHYSHFTPRDFDLSPYFKVVKPTLHAGFNYKNIKWVEKS